tara:strand:- start:1757 stop:3178 length:1422 start_codon:yes stop_codon:yes gene_type:complete
MLNKLRNFSKGKLAGVLVGIIIIPFVFWGMGSVFSGGNTNSIAKINSYNVSTQDFADFINNSKISNEVIRENIENNIIEELLAQLVSTSLIDIEIIKLKISISDEILAKKIKNEKSFHDENNNFSRTKYEKFLLETNTPSIKFEQEIRDNELKKKLFKYIGGGIKSPYFLLNKEYKEETKKIEIDYINLNSLYVKKDEISLDKITKHVEENKDKFLIENIDIDYIKITPKNMLGESEFTEEFFLKIDEIEDLVINNLGINDISKKYNLKINSVNDYNSKNEDNELLNEIYNKRNEKSLDIVDKNDFFLLYEVKNIKKILPNISDEVFLNLVKNDLYELSKYDTHKDLLIKIQKNNFTNQDFSKLTKGTINNLKFNSIKDTNKFTIDSLKLIYSLGVNNFTLVSDNDNNVYLAKIKNVFENDIERKSKKIKKFSNRANSKIRNDLYNSYDLLLNEKYNIEINQKTLDRTKNYFR